MNRMRVNWGRNVRYSNREVKHFQIKEKYPQTGYARLLTHPTGIFIVITKFSDRFSNEVKLVAFVEISES